MCECVCEEEDNERGVSMHVCESEEGDDMRVK